MLYHEQKKLYETKRAQAHVSESVLFGLVWDVVGFETIFQQNRTFVTDIHELLRKLCDPCMMEASGNVAKLLCLMKSKLSEYSKGVFGK